MHPILGRIERLAAYLALWLIVGGLLSGVLTGQRLAWSEALVFVLPVVVVYAFVCLSAWYVCRAMPLASHTVPAVIAAAVFAGASAGGIWVGLTAAWIGLLESLPSLVPVTARYRQQTPILFAASVLLFLLVLAVHYVVLAFEAVGQAERQQLELAMLTRDAELRALRAQVDPHFLYNSLNSISALTSTDAAGARRMCLLLADFLRSTLRVSTENTITLGEDLALAERFISIEQVRFGARLQVRRQVDDAACRCLVPPLLLQPLIENAVMHGIAGLVDGGVIGLDVVCLGDRIRIAIENPRDPDATQPGRGGVGLDNVRRRLGITFGPAARLEAVSLADRFRVEIEVPCGATR